MEQTVKERLIIFMRKKGLSQKRFEQAVGLSNGYINQLRHSPSATKLQRIIDAFPDLNDKWLMTGQGEMLKTEKKEEEPRPTFDVTVDKDTLIKLLLHANEHMSEQMAELLQRIKNLEEEVRASKKDDAKSSLSDSANNQQEKNKVS